MKLLIVEDEPLLLEEVERFMKDQGFLCEKAVNYAEAEEKVTLYQYDVIILDISLPGGSGLHILQLLKKQHKEAGVLIISAKDSLTDKLKGLDLGADDYLTKPFHLEELNARVNALLRRKSFNGNPEIVLDDLIINTQAKSVYHNKTEIVLTKKEYELLLYFIINKNRVLSKQSIAEHLWGDHYDLAESYDIIYVHTTNLRKKIVKETGVDNIKTIYGMGYKWISP